MRIKKLSMAIILASYLVPLSADQVMVDDLIVQGSICAGFDCVNGENFGADTLVLKENNLRIYFNDTSNSGSFPSNDWRITANDQTNGGANRFSIDDATSGRTVFNIEAAAPSNTLYLDSTGNIGLGTSTPVLNLHVRDGNTPAIRLDQDGSSGFASQVWDVAGNETNFFVRDATNGSLIPFKIRPGAPNNSMYIDSNGKVGLGTPTPDANLHVIGNVMIAQTDTGAGDAPLHVQRSDGTAAIHVQETSSTVAKRTMLTIENNGKILTNYINSADNQEWRIGVTDSSFIVSSAQSGGHELQIFDDGSVQMGYGGAQNFLLDPSGNLTTAGTVNGASDKNLKENFAAIDSKEILKAIDTLPVSSWNYIADNDQVRHIGPTAQDFHEKFHIGMDDKHISMMDAASIAIIGVQQLKKELDAKNAEIEKLNNKIADLEAMQARMVNLEMMVQQLASAKDANSMKTFALRVNH